MKKLDAYTDEETAKRRDDALRNALSTPPTKHAPLGKKNLLVRAKPPSAEVAVTDAMIRAGHEAAAVIVGAADCEAAQVAGMTPQTPKPKTNKANEAHVLTRDIDCPWCIAKAGERCWDIDRRGGFRTDMVHLARSLPAHNLGDKRHD